MIKKMISLLLLVACEVDLDNAQSCRFVADGTGNYVCAYPDKPCYWIQAPGASVDDFVRIICPKDNDGVEKYLEPGCWDIRLYKIGHENDWVGGAAIRMCK